VGRQSAALSGQSPRSNPAGYSGTPLLKKLGVKENHRVVLVNAPSGFRKELGKLPPGVEFVAADEELLDLVLLFVDSQAKLNYEFPKLVSRLAPDGMIWTAWPKKASGVQTDLSFDPVQKVGLANGLVDTKICAIDETWSGLKFVFRLRDRKNLNHKGHEGTRRNRNPKDLTDS
jgi:hypothetical protein